MMRKTFVSSIIVLLLFASFMSVINVVGATNYTFSNGYESGDFGMWTGLRETSGGDASIVSSPKHSGSYAMKANTPGGAGSAASYINFGANYATFNVTEYVYWNTGNPNNGDGEGVKIASIGNTYPNTYISALIYNSAGTYCFGVRRCSSSGGGTWSTLYNTSATATKDTWYLVSLVTYSTGWDLYVGGVKVLTETVTLYSTNYAIGYVGNTYAGAVANIVYLDDVAITGYGGTTPPSFYYYNSQTTIHANGYGIQYPAVVGGYLVITEGRDPTNLYHAYIQRYTLGDTQTLVDSAELGHNISEPYSAFLIGDHYIIPAITGGHAGAYYNASITVLNNVTLAEEMYLEYPQSTATAAINVMYYPPENQVVIGMDTWTGAAMILRVPYGSVNVSGAYSWVTIDPTSWVGDDVETMPVYWNGTIWVIATGPCDGSSPVTTKLYRLDGTLASGSWATVDSWTTTNTPSGAYFAKLTASEEYLVAGFLDTGNYMVGVMDASGTWTEYDTGVNEGAGEDHVNVNALSTDIFLVEPTQRSGSQPHTIYAFNATSGVLTSLFTVAGTSTGYDDRWVGIDVAHSTLYLADCYGPTSQYTGEIVKIGWNLELVTLEYNYPTEPEPTPTPTPSPTPAEPTAAPTIPRTPTSIVDLNFHGVVTTQNGVTGYVANSSTPTTSAHASPIIGYGTAGDAVSYGIRVYAVTRSTVELTSGVVTVGTLTGTQTITALTTQTVLSGTHLTFGNSTLKFVLYGRFGSGDWSIVQTMTTRALNYKQLFASEVTVTLYADRNESGGNTYSSAYWGNVEGGEDPYSGVSGLVFKTATSTDWQQYYLNQGNLVRFITIPYTFILGNVFYGIIVVALAGTVFARYRTLGMVALFLVLFFGCIGGAAANIVLGEVIVGVVWIATAFGLAVVYWRVFR